MYVRYGTESILMEIFREKDFMVKKEEFSIRL